MPIKLALLVLIAASALIAGILDVRRPGDPGQSRATQLNPAKPPRPRPRPVTESTP